MKKVVVLTALRSGSNYLVDNLIRSIEKKYSTTPSHEHYYRSPTDSVTKIDSVISDNYSVIKLSWLVHLHELGKIENLSTYDAILLKRKDKLAQSISMITALQNPEFTFNFYKDHEELWNEWLKTDPKCYISKEAFHLYFWMRESLEKGAETFRSQFKTFTEIYYEDIDDNLENLKKLLKDIDLPDHENHQDDFISKKRNWDKWGSVINKDEVIGWAEKLFQEEGYTIDPKYYNRG